ncbi:hypothetical protein AAP_02711 [Ascosphaera apis ARSEF 7405]|uniref:F-box domain-containing protein n=1 Tax=Ascosphaera apis ARSEF 7405 TaxID=392613 RepID=A0A166NV30_9EURO|nr:hypothetical protein AAP_02711 [Ascosphaera apis ARSEF 7405]
MATSIINLISISNDVLFCITDFLELEELKRLRSTHRRLCEAISPLVFKNVQFTNNNDDAHAVLQILAKYPDRIRQLRFNPSIPEKHVIQRLAFSEPRLANCLISEEATQKLMELFFPPVVCTLLRGCDEPLKTQLRQLDTIRITTPRALWFHPHTGWKWGFEEFGLDVISLLMDRFWTLISENRYPKRILVDETQTLSLQRGFPKWRGQQPRRHLPISFARTVAWHYHPVVIKLRSSEMTREIMGTPEHPKEVQSLKIELPSECYPFGLSRHNIVVPHVPLPPPFSLTPCICELRKLELVRCCISTGLADFIDNHATTLQTFILRDCFAQSDFPFEMSWNGLFKRMAQLDDRSVLTDFQVINTDVCLTLQDVYQHCDSKEDPGVEVPEEASAAAQRIRRSIADSASQRKLFSYVMLGSCYLDSMPDYNMNVRMFDEGLDQNAYDELMELVSARKERIGSLCPPTSLRS